jgi:hypothetical protein
MSLVLTSSMEDHFQGLLLDDLQKIAPEAYSNRIANVARVAVALQGKNLMAQGNQAPSPELIALFSGSGTTVDEQQMSL